MKTTSRALQAHGMFGIFDVDGVRVYRPRIHTAPMSR